MRIGLTPHRTLHRRTSWSSREEEKEEEERQKEEKKEQEEEEKKEQEEEEKYQEHPPWVDGVGHRKEVSLQEHTQDYPRLIRLDTQAKSSMRMRMRMEDGAIVQDRLEVERRM